LFLLAVVYVSIILSGNAQKGNKANEEITQTVNTDILYEKGIEYMDAGDYYTAQDIFKELLDTSENEKASTIYKILYNYNCAVEKFDQCDYDSAYKFLEKIPAKYTNYSICDDVESLENDISEGLAAYEIFYSIEKFVSQEDYRDAKDAVGIIDISLLSNDDEDKLNEYISLINKKIKELEEKEESKSSLSQAQAETLIMEYCDAFVKAINNKDFEIVAPYMHYSSEIYSQQKKLIQSYITDGITEKFDYLELISLQKVSDNKWTALVKEGETIYYKSGKTEVMNYKWTYTIEYIDSDFYLTKIR